MPEQHCGRRACKMRAADGRDASFAEWPWVDEYHSAQRCRKRAAICAVRNDVHLRQRFDDRHQWYATRLSCRARNSRLQRRRNGDMRMCVFEILGAILNSARTQRSFERAVGFYAK